MTYVVGVDTSSTRLAISLPGRKTYIVDATGSPDERRRVLFRGAREIFETLPDGAWIACEEPLALPKSGKTTSMLNLAAGAIWAAHLDFDVYWLWIAISSWKREIVGNAHAKKPEIRDFCESNPAFRGEDREQFLTYPDLFDSWCIRVYGRRQVANLPRTLP